MNVKLPSARKCQNYFYRGMQCWKGFLKLLARSSGMKVRADYYTVASGHPTIATPSMYSSSLKPKKPVLST